MRKNLKSWLLIASLNVVVLMGSAMLVSSALPAGSSAKFTAVAGGPSIPVPAGEQIVPAYIFYFDPATGWSELESPNSTRRRITFDGLDPDVIYNVVIVYQGAVRNSTYTGGNGPSPNYAKEPSGAWVGYFVYGP
jgi:hypothetical protein